MYQISKSSFQTGLYLDLLQKSSFSSHLGPRVQGWILPPTLISANHQIGLFFIPKVAIEAYFASLYFYNLTIHSTPHIIYTSHRYFRSFCALLIPHTTISTQEKVKSQYWFFFHQLSHLGEVLPQLAHTFRLKHRADNIAGVRITRELPVPLRNPAHSNHLPPAEGLCENLSDIHPVCALGRRQTNAMTRRYTSRSAPPRFRWITFEITLNDKNEKLLH
jgi:hypothetical protein